MKVLQGPARSCLLALFLAVLVVPSFAAQNVISDPNVEISLNYPDVVVQGQGFVISSVAKANVDQVSNMTVTISCPELQMQQGSFHVDKLPKDSSFGNNFNATVNRGTPDGSFVANVEVDYFVKGFFDAQPVKHSVTQTIRFVAASKPSILVNLQTPSNVFAGEPFSIKGTIANQGSGIHDLQLSAYSSEVLLQGKKSLMITNLNPGESTSFEFAVQTQKDLGDPTNAVIHVNGTYVDDGGRSYSVDNSFSVFARQRGMLEMGDANGIWVGQFFIAPVVGVGTIVSSVIGFLIFLWHYRNKKKKRRAKRSQ